jgi:hypothetical protein
MSTGMVILCGIVLAPLAALTVCGFILFFSLTLESVFERMQRAWRRR